MARFALSVVENAVRDQPTMFKREPLKANRGDRVSLGIKCDHPGMGVLLPYAVRGTPGLEIAWPVAWKEVGKRRNGDVRVATFSEFMTGGNDPFAELVAACSKRPPMHPGYRPTQIRTIVTISADSTPGPVQAHDFILHAA